MVAIKEAVVVEGRYDTIRLKSIVDTVIVQTNGFRIFKDKAQLSLLRRLATERGLVVLTDSDAAGFMIRDHIDAAVPKDCVKHAYIPPVVGKESRKSAPSKEGLLGVEGLDGDVLLDALYRAGVTVEGETADVKPPYLTTARLFDDGLTGRADSKRKRQKLCELLSLPTYLSTARLMTVLNAAYTEEEYAMALAKIDG